MRIPNLHGNVYLRRPANRPRRALAGLATFLVAVSFCQPASAATQQELESARQRRQALQQELDATVASYDQAQSQLASTQEALQRYEKDLEALEAESEQVRARVSERAREVYRQGPSSMFQFLIGAENFSDFGRRMKLLQEAAEQDASILQEAEITRTKVSRLQADVAAQEAQERQLLEDMADQAESLESKFSEARQLESQLVADKSEAERLARQREAAQAAQRAAEEQARRAAEQEAAREAEELQSQRAAAQQAAESPVPAPAPAEPPAPSPSPAGNDAGTGSSAGGPSSSGLYCPVDGPVSFTDTFGHPRSGGRSHEGVDMFAAQGTPVAAITDGRITRRSSSTLGGLYIYFTGTDGTEYFYTHLSGYTDVPVGTAIKGGTHIGYVGNTGNARGTPPHLHFEVAPPGRGTINPTPTARSACGK